MYCEPAMEFLPMGENRAKGVPPNRIV